MAGRSRRIDTARWAEFWDVNIRSVQRWVKDGLPVEEPEAMARCILAMKRPADGPRAKAEEILLRADRRIPGVTELPAGAENDDFGNDGSFPVFSDEEVASAQVNLQMQAKHAWVQLHTATKRNDQASIRFWGEELRKTQKAIRDDELHAKRMGVDSGEILNRPEVERIIRALAFWMVRSVDKDIEHLAPLLLNLTYIEEAIDVLDRFFMGKRFLAAFSKSVTTPCGVALPDWLLEVMRDAVDDYYEPNGADEEKEFSTFMAMTAGRPKEEAG